MIKLSGNYQFWAGYLDPDSAEAAHGVYDYRGMYTVSSAIKQIEMKAYDWAHLVEWRYNNPHIVAAYSSITGQLQDEEGTLIHKMDFTPPSDEMPESRGLLYRAYTDGACKRNPGPGGYAVRLEAIQPTAGEPVVATNMIIGRKKDTTNNEMELLAILAALDYLPIEWDEEIEEWVGNVVHIFTDSEWAMRCAIGEYRRNAHGRWWKIYDFLTKFHTPIFHKVKGHSDDDLNNLVDQAARKQSELAGIRKDAGFWIHADTRRKQENYINGKIEGQESR